MNTENAQQFLGKKSKEQMCRHFAVEKIPAAKYLSQINSHLSDNLLKFYTKQFEQQYKMAK